MTRRPRYADVAATLALALAVSGGAYAATQLPKNSITTKQVKNATLLAKDFKPGQLPRGPQGASGASGATGEPGAAGPNVLVAGQQNGASGTVPGCSTYDLRGADFTVPRPALVELHAQAGYKDTGNAVHSPTVLLRLFNSHDATVAQAPAAEGGLTAGTFLSTTGLATSGGTTLFVLQPGTTYHAVLSLDPGGGGCANPTAVTSPALTWLAYPVPS